MKLISMRCPNCNAELQINAELKNGVCNYCGNTIVIDDEVIHHQIDIDNAFDLGYQQELGRQKALNDIKEQKEREIAEKKRIEAEKRRLEAIEQQKEAEEKREVDSINSITIFIVCMVGFILMVAACGGWLGYF